MGRPQPYWESPTDIPDLSDTNTGVNTVMGKGGYWIDTDTDAGSLVKAVPQELTFVEDTLRVSFVYRKIPEDREILLLRKGGPVFFD
jgi:hypothetical protein